VAAAH